MPATTAVARPVPPAADIPPQPLLDIYEVALRFRAETSALVAREAAGPLLSRPDDRWEQVIRGRRHGPACDTLATAARALVRMADPPMRPFVKRAARRLTASVEALANFRPNYLAEAWPAVAGEESSGAGMSSGAEEGAGQDITLATWTVDPASLARFDELRVDVYTRLVELEALFRDYPDALSRVISVAQRVAGFLAERIGAGPAAGAVGESGVEEGRASSVERVRRWLDRLAGTGG